MSKETREIRRQDLAELDWEQRKNLDLRKSEICDRCGWTRVDHGWWSDGWISCKRFKKREAPTNG